MDESPDIYADAFRLAANEFGVTITLVRSDPPTEAGATGQLRSVGRVRMSIEMCHALSRALASAKLASTQTAQESGQSH